MINIQGQITQIDEVNNNFNDKYVAVVKQTDNEDCFVEFRGKVMMNVLRPYRVGESVTISAFIEGKTSKFSGARYNNIVARNIKTLTP